MSIIYILNSIFIILPCFFFIFFDIRIIFHSIGFNWLMFLFCFAAMSLEESRRSQRPYRYGMVLLCVGALINWLGLAENYVEPVRYVGVACIVAGALLICAAMCCWLHAPPARASVQAQHPSHPITAQVRTSNLMNFVLLKWPLKIKIPHEYYW